MHEIFLGGVVGVELKVELRVGPIGEESRIRQGQEL